MNLHEAVRTISAYVAKNYGPACSHCKTFYAEQGSPFCAGCADESREYWEAESESAKSVAFNKGDSR